MKFSIIVPVYNAAAFVADTIENLLKQNVDKEIILVNDGSSDNSLDILRSYESRYECIHVIDKPNGGVASARNKGIDYATGDIVIFVDSDDFIDEKLLERSARILTDGEIDLVLFSFKYSYVNSNLEVVHSYKETGKYDIKEFLDDFYNIYKIHILHCIGTKIYKTAVIRERDLKFKEDISYCEDIGFCVRYLGGVKEIYYINEPLYDYRVINPNSLMSGYKKGLSRANKYRRDGILYMFQKIYGKEELPWDILYKVFSDDLISCIENALKTKGLSAEQIEDEMESILKTKHLDEYIENASSMRNKKILKTLKMKDQIALQRKIKRQFEMERRWETFIIQPLRKIYHFIRRR